MAEQTSMNKTPYYISLRTKLLVGFTLVISVVFVIAYYWFLNFGTQLALDMIREDLTKTLNAAIGGVNGDQFEALVMEGKPDENGVPGKDPRYIRHQEWIYRVHQVEPRAVPYTYVKGPGEREVLWVGDVFRITSPEDATLFLDSYTPTKDFMLQGLETVIVDMEGYPDEWGTWVSAYGPIKNSKGEVVGAVGIDFYQDYVNQVRQKIMNDIMVAFAVTYIVLIALIFLIARQLTRPLVYLKNAARLIGEGDYTPDLSIFTHGRTTDEINSLAENFNIMVQKVSQREQTLRRQVEELKIEIDESKRTHQVSEIIDTDFFRDLQARADRMRSRRKGEPITPAPNAETEAPETAPIGPDGPAAPAADSNE